MENNQKINLILSQFEAALKEIRIENLSLEESKELKKELEKTFSSFIHKMGMDIFFNAIQKRLESINDKL
jgi:hypothetical protein